MKLMLSLLTPAVISNGKEYAKDITHTIPNETRFHNTVIFGPNGLHTGTYLWIDITRSICAEIPGMQIWRKERTRQAKVLG